MDINITGKQLDVTPALRDFTREKLDKIIRHFDRITSIHVIFKVEKLRKIAEATIQIPRESINAKAESNDNMYSAVDGLIDKLDRQIKRHKEKDDEHRS
ncbi:MAG: ribosome-associated translation inhibitor RaiA [Pseudomonadota bacterium]